MGVFDTIIIEEKCPFCSYKQEFGFQTKAIGEMMRTFRINDEIKALDFIIKEGTLKNCLNSCKKCDKIIYCDFNIFDGKIKNYKIKKRGSRK